MKTACAWVTTSWDDGHPLDFRVAELLAKYGLTGTFYVPRRAETKVMSEVHLRELGLQFEIGAHTVDHVYLDSVPPGQANYQIAESKRWIEATTGTNCRLFCFPGGKFRTEHLRMAREAGFSAARTAELLSLDLPRVRGPITLIPTTLQAFPHKWTAYVRNGVRRGRLTPLMRLWPGCRAQDWTGLAKMLAVRALARNGVFHLWGHSWEIHQNDLWRELEVVLAFLGSLKKSVQVRTNSGLMEACRAA